MRLVQRHNFLLQRKRRTSGRTRSVESRSKLPHPCGFVETDDGYLLSQLRVAAAGEERIRSTLHIQDAHGIPTWEQLLDVLLASKEDDEVPV